MSLAEILKTFNDETELVPTEDGFQEKDADGISLKGVLQRKRAKQLREKEVWRVGQTFSPSTITRNYCRRIKVAQLAGKTELFYGRATPRQQTNFDLGNIIHELIQGYFWDVGMLKGTFYCLSCDDVFEDTAPKSCPKGHPKRFLRYNEVKLTNDDYKLSGRADAILKCDELADEPVVDIKSIAGRTLKTNGMQFCFEDLEKGPKDDHVVQINLYMFMKGCKSGHLLYINKNDGQIKTFAIPYDSKVIEPYLSEVRYLLDLAARYKSGDLEIGGLPEPCGKKDCNCHEFLTKG